MNKPVQILLLIALFPMIGMAREETLEERKQRIVRKYLREDLAITQSDMVVPTDLPEDERIKDSEKFLDAEVDLQKHDASATPMMPPPQRPRPVPRADSNWLLDTEETADASDPYADPFASSSMDFGSEWNTPSEQRETGTSRRERSYSPYARSDSSRGMIDGRSQQDPSASGQQQGSGYGSSSIYSGRSDLFGQSRQDERSTYESGVNLQNSRARTYGSDPSEGLLVSPYPQLDASSSREERKPGAQGYKPYRSPYDQQREQRAQQRGSQVQPQKQEYKRSDSYQQFKDRNKTWDPTQDDAYISEMMQQPKR